MECCLDYGLFLSAFSVWRCRGLSVAGVCSDTRRCLCSVSGMQPAWKHAQTVRQFSLAFDWKVSWTNDRLAGFEGQRHVIGSSLSACSDVQMFTRDSGIILTCSSSQDPRSSFFSITECPSYTVVNCRRLSFSSCHCLSCLERTTTPHYVCSIHANLLQSSVDLSFQLFLLFPLSVLPVKWLVSLSDSFIAFVIYLLVAHRQWVTSLATLWLPVSNQ